ncbi:EAL domain-containing protein [Alteromonas facilis]|uniref:bifunctional diguanylate cyclase/phosphodiesterase n=1 Tax=Alteromonas facilis TaxID=2048004 RepID=UPI000C2958B6|nr:EAL domain-containing protein [Alteromonas facilis]
MMYTFESFVNEKREDVDKELNFLKEKSSAYECLLSAHKTEPCAFSGIRLLTEPSKLLMGQEYPTQNSFLSGLCDNKVTLLSNLKSQYPKDMLIKVLGADELLCQRIAQDHKNTIHLTLFFTSERADMSLAGEWLSMVSHKLCLMYEHWLTLKKCKEQLSLFSEVSKISKVGAWSYSIENDEMYWSDEVFHIYGMKPSDKVNPEIGISCYQESDRNIITQAFVKAVESGQPYQHELKFKDIKGVSKWVRTNGRVERDETGSVMRVYGAIEDISDEVLQIKRESERADYLKNIFDSFKDAVLVINEKGIIQSCNLGCLTIFGYQEEELLGKPLTMLMPEPYRSAHDSYIENYLSSGNSKIIGIGRQLPATRKNGDIFQMELAVTESLYHGHYEFIGFIRDITDKINARDAVYRMAFTDPITGLKNRAWFEKEASSLFAIAKLKQQYIYASILDIDRLEKINRKFGVAFGNTVIKAVGERLTLLHHSDVHVYKASADAFIILSVKGSKDPNIVDAIRVSVDSVLASIRKIEVSYEGEAIPITVSMGSVITSTATSSLETLTAQLEYALFKAKSIGLAGQYLLSGERIDAYEQQTNMQEVLETVTQTDELYVVLQPQFSSRTEFGSSEVLLRWNSPVFGQVSPGEFIPLAEKTSAIIAIEKWVIKEACRILKKVKSKGYLQTLAVNISAKHLVHPSFSTSILKTVREHGISPSSLILEITESELVNDLDEVKQKMIDLRAIGFRFSIDDFGTGYSSLAYLQALPLDELKIDKQFVDAINPDEKSSRSIINLILDMADVLGVRTVAEGVETDIQYDILKAKTCDVIQGYLLSKPLNEDEWFSMLVATEQNVV